MRAILFSLVLVLAGAASALAHHPFSAEFDQNKPITLTGTVTEFEWREPHSAVHIEATDGGKSTEWVVELGGMQDLRKTGWNEQTLKVGDMITIHGWRAKNGSRTANARDVAIASGATLQAASSFDQEVAGTSGTLPDTAGPVPVVGLFGALSLLGACGIRFVRR